MKKYPIGIQSFQEIREGGYLYVDKTRYLHDLIGQGKYYFLSRPRRFGKSLTVSTLRAIFEGKKGLFGGLWIEDRYDFSEVYPVIHIELSGIAYKGKGLAKALNDRLGEIAAEHGVELSSDVPDGRLRELVLLLSQKNRVALLIDEYDKPVIDHLEDPAEAERKRDFLKSFYAPLKSLDPHLRFVLLTGVSKFSCMSIFSELNNLKDLSPHARFSTMLGYTEAEMAEYFSGEVEELAAQKSCSPEDVWEEIREWYNGYSWDGKTRVYNPFSVLSFFDSGEFRNFWFQTGTPTFLVKLLSKEGLYRFDRVRAHRSSVESFELGKITPLSLLFQTGYVTITEQKGQVLTLDMPNREVRESMAFHLLESYMHRPSEEASEPLLSMVEALEGNDLERFFGCLDVFYAKVPYDLFLERLEAYYHAILYLALELLGYEPECEVHTFKGRSDLVIEMEGRVYVMEFKLDAPAESALQQIREKGYADPYRNGAREVLLVGVSFSSGKKGVGEWKAERL